MEKEEVWSTRVREWRASGASMAAFSRGKEFTAAGLSYWVRRLGAAPSAKPVRLARVIRKERGIETDQTLRSTRPAAASVRGLVVQAGALRVQVADELDGAQLELVMIALGRAARVVGT